MCIELCFLVTVVVISLMIAVVEWMSGVNLVHFLSQQCKVSVFPLEQLLDFVQSMLIQTAV